MKVFKFGGASVCSADGIRNIMRIVQLADEPLFVVVSAMGKTTNALEVVLEQYMRHYVSEALEKLQDIEAYHNEVAVDLLGDLQIGRAVLQPLFSELKSLLTDSYPIEYDRCYDQIVSYGELLSTTLVAAFLNKKGMACQWLDMRRLLLTDSNFREANVLLEKSQQRLRKAVDFAKVKIYVGQGFIGGNAQGQPTTLGREGSDYTAAVVGNLLRASSVTIWKDVPGILNADPRLFPHTVLIPELTYYDAVELAYSGAQVIHPKTIRPLENKQIPLYVKPFNHPEEDGSVIKAAVRQRIEVPVFILRKNQVLVTVRPLNFSFVLEESLPKIFATIHRHRLKVSLIQSSAVTISVCVDKTRYLADALDELQQDFSVSFNEDLELLTIRGTTPEIMAEAMQNREVLLTQKTRRTVKYVFRNQPTAAF